MTGVAAARVRAAYATLAQANRPEVWISLKDREEALRDADAVDSRVAAGEQLPLAGVVVAVKDNIDVAGFPTTAGCPEFGYRPTRSAPVVQRLVDAGAVVLGKTNMDQFATGLVGTRSPYGEVGSASDPDRVAGGSSSGSAVAVALGAVDLALGTDTAGSGRVPAAFQGIVGFKPTRGLVPATGTVPACQEYDCVSLFGRTAAEVYRAAPLLPGPDPTDPYSRGWPVDAPMVAGRRPTVGVARIDDLPELDAPWRRRYAQTILALHQVGIDTVEVDVADMLAVGRLMYDGALVASRYTAVGDFVAAHPDRCDPIVARIITAAGALPAHRLVSDQHTLAAARAATVGLFAGVSAIALPTSPEHPTRAAVAADPVGVNTRLGTYTNFCNLLDLCAVSIAAVDPEIEAVAGPESSGCFGVTLYAPAFHDGVLADLALRIEGGPPGRRVFDSPAVPIVVVGAHLRGQPLNLVLEAAGGSFVRAARTAAVYRLYDLLTEPAKPGLVRVAAGTGTSIEVEVWAVPPVALADLVQSVRAPLGIGRVLLHDGTAELGFVCEAAGVVDRPDISALGGWVAYRNRVGVASR